MKELPVPKLLLCFHEHLGAGAKDDEFEERYLSRIKPILTCLYETPEILAALHFSGTLLERLEGKKPESFLLIRDLLARKQLELLGGGYYEPLLPLLPPPDKIGQIEMLSTYLRQHFGKRPQGCLLPFMIWEQPLTGTLRFCGMNYTFLSEQQFREAGIADTEPLFPMLTEDQGKLITVIPALKGASLQDFAAGGPPCRLAAFIPCFTGTGGEEEIRRFFAELEQGCKERRFEFCLPAKTLRQAGPFRRAYFSNSADAALLGGEGLCVQPRKLLTLLPEANKLYVKMFFIHSLIQQLRGDKQRKKNAREELWKAQEADAYRHAPDSPTAALVHAWKALLRTERTARDKAAAISAFLVFDLDMDGQNDCLFQDKTVNFYVGPAGAALFELDYLPRGWNYLAVTGGVFSDWLLPPETDPETLRRFWRYSAEPCEDPGVHGRRCGNEIFELTADRGRDEAVFRLGPREGIPFGGVEIEKHYRLEKSVLWVSYTLTNRKEALDVDLIPRMELAFAASCAVSPQKPPAEGDPARLFAQGPDAPAAAGIRGFEAIDAKNAAAVSLSSDTPFDLWFFDGAENAKDGGRAAFLPRFHITLETGSSWEAVLSLTVNPAKPCHNP
jgi:hypothetical protein